MKQTKKQSNKFSNKVFSFKITLKGSSPRVWRRILVPADYTFFEFSSAIQVAMGWSDGHLHGFSIDKRGQSKVKRGNNFQKMIFIQFPDPWFDNEMSSSEEFLDERNTYIADWFPEKIKQCVYEYDFGDGWEHTVLFEKELSRDRSTVYPQCPAGKNACPPDDCGGVLGYEELQVILNDPKHSEHEDMLDWLGLESAEEFDPHYFDPQAVVFVDPEDRLKFYEDIRGGF